jgi:hypothetical protein
VSPVYRIFCKLTTAIGDGSLLSRIFWWLNTAAITACWVSYHSPRSSRSSDKRQLQYNSSICSQSTTVDNVAFVFCSRTVLSLSVGVPEVVLQPFRYLQLIVKIPGILAYYCHHSEKRERMRKRIKTTSRGRFGLIPHLGKPNAKFKSIKWKLVPLSYIL